MPQLAFPDLTKEIDIGGRKIPLYVPIAGAGIAVALVIIAKVTGKGETSSAGQTTGNLNSSAQAQAQAVEPAQTAPAQDQATQDTDMFTSALTQLAGQFETAQSNLAEQITTAQGGISQLTSAQQALAGQYQTVQGQMGEQAQAFQAGIAGVQSQAARFRADTSMRLDAVEHNLGLIQKEVANQANAGPSRQTKKLIADNLGLIISYGINPLNSRAGLQQWQTEFDGQTGAFRWNPGGGWIQVF